MVPSGSRVAGQVVLDVRQIRRQFGSLDVFGQLSFTVSAGQALCLVGANGSGKSTALRCICGADTPSEGSTRIFDTPVDERSVTTRRHIAMVIDDLEFFPDLSVAEHLDLLARAHSVTSPEHVVERVLDDVGLAAQAQQLPGTLSTGQTQRLGLATAFVRPRTLLVLDEPEQRLDRSGLTWLTNRIKQEMAHGLAIVFASHDARLVDAVADDVITLGDPA